MPAWASPFASRLAVPPGRIEFVILGTGRSPSGAPHTTSRRRSSSRVPPGTWPAGKTSTFLFEHLLRRTSGKLLLAVCVPLCVRHPIDTGRDTGAVLTAASLTSKVYQAAPYRARAARRDTFNTTDSIYLNGGRQSTLTMRRDGKGGYVGTIHSQTGGVDGTELACQPGFRRYPDERRLHPVTTVGDQEGPLGESTQVDC